MKHLLLFLSFLSASAAYTQIKEAYFQYHIDVEAADTSIQTKQTVAMLRDSRMELYFSPGKSRVDFKMGNISVTSVIVDREKNSTLSISDGYNGKIALLGKADDVKPIEKNPLARVDFFDEEKVILGYKCKKMILEEDGIATEYWYTDKINIDTDDSQAISPYIPGFPLLFSKIEDGVKMTFQLSNMREYHEHPLEMIFFTTPPPGFRLITTAP